MSDVIMREVGCDCFKEAELSRFAAVYHQHPFFQEEVPERSLFRFVVASAMQDRERADQTRVAIMAIQKLSVEKRTYRVTLRAADGKALHMGGAPEPKVLRMIAGFSATHANDFLAVMEREHESGVA
jgi:hypothetical protein